MAVLGGSVEDLVLCRSAVVLVLSGSVLILVLCRSVLVLVLCGFVLVLVLCGSVVVRVYDPCPCLPAGHLSGTMSRGTVLSPKLRTESSGRSMGSAEPRKWSEGGLRSGSCPGRMAFNEFVRNYSRIEVCTLTPDTIDDDSVKPWSVSKFDGTWRRGSTAGGCRNNACQYQLWPGYQGSDGSVK